MKSVSFCKVAHHAHTEVGMDLYNIAQNDVLPVLEVAGYFQQFFLCHLDTTANFISSLCDIFS